MEKLDPRNWVPRYGEALFRYALMRCPGREVAEDMVQETFLAALGAKESFSGHSPEKTWLFGILRHKLADYYRVAARETPVDLTANTGEDVFFDSRGKWRKDRRPVRCGEKEEQDT